MKQSDVEIFDDERQCMHLTLRSYRDVAKILAVRDGVQITPERVRQICSEAKKKIAAALLADPDYRPHVLGIAARSRRALDVQGADWS